LKLGIGFTRKHISAIKGYCFKLFFKEKPAKNHAFFVVMILASFFATVSKTTMPEETRAFVGKRFAIVCEQS